MGNPAEIPLPESVLFHERDRGSVLPVCDHYCGSPELLHKSLTIQARLGPLFDITADGEDGAPEGDASGHAARMAQVLGGPDNRHGRVGARTHPVHHPCFQAELAQWMSYAGCRLAYLTLPKVSSVADIMEAEAHCLRHEQRVGRMVPLPFHVLIESPTVLARLDEIAAHPRVEALCFGMMDYVSSFCGAVSAQAMQGARQFEHPLMARALVDISLAAHAHGKVAVHSVTQAMDNGGQAAGEDARRAARDFGYQRKWSIHPCQIEPIVSAFRPASGDVQTAIDILLAARAVCWGPIQYQGHLQDRASYRYWWQVLKQGRATGMALPAAAEPLFGSAGNDQCPARI